MQTWLNYHTEKMPHFNRSMPDDMLLAWQQHDRVHTDTPDFKYIILWATKHLQ